MVFFSRSFRPRVSRTKSRQKMKPRKFSAPKYQRDPWIFMGELIMYSNVNEMSTRLIDWALSEKPEAASTVTSGM